MIVIVTVMIAVVVMLMTAGTILAVSFLEGIVAVRIQNTLVLP
jgi:hypothetical protein